MATVRYDHVTRCYPGNPQPSVNDLTLDIHDGEFMVLVGPSGCGKSTTLRMLAGLETVNKGHIYIDNCDVTSMPPKNRDVAMVFQNYALYPYLTVAENMGFALKIAKMPADQIRKKVNEAAKILGLVDLLERKPFALSGGQCQRVAMGRAIVRDPKVFLMDEPLSNLDAKLRVQMRTEIAQLQHQLHATTLYVTHDQTEALTMGDRIAVMKDGVLQQCGTPMDLYNHPLNSFVASFIGSPSMNLLEASIHDHEAYIGGGRIMLPDTVYQHLIMQKQTHVILGVRPEHMHIASEKTKETICMTVISVENLGADGYVHGTYQSNDSSAMNAMMIRVSPTQLPHVGENIFVDIDMQKLHFFSQQTGSRLE